MDQSVRDFRKCMRLDGWRPPLPLSVAERIDLERVFKQIANSNDSIDSRNLLDAFISVGVDGMSLKNCADLIWESGGVSEMIFLEFSLCYLNGRSRLNSPKRLFSFILFKMIDSNSDGFISADEMRVFAAQRILNFSDFFSRFFNDDNFIKCELFMKICESSLFEKPGNFLSYPPIPPKINFVFRFKKDAKICWSKTVAELKENTRRIEIIKKTAEFINIPKRLIHRKSELLHPDISIRPTIGLKADLRKIDQSQKSDPVEISESLRTLRELKMAASRNGVSVVDMEILKKKFDEFDTDRSGLIDESEFRWVLMDVFMASEISEKDAKRVWNDIRRKNYQGLSLDEFVDWYRRIK